MTEEFFYTILSQEVKFEDDKNFEKGILMNYGKAVFFDYDGTLSDEEVGIYYPTEKTVEAVKKLRKKGIFVCLATGRAKCYAPVESLEFDGFVTSNGAYAEIGGREVYRKVFPKELYLEAKKYFKSLGICYAAENQDRCYAVDKEDKDFKMMIENFNIPSEVFYPIEGLDAETVYKILLAYPSEQAFLDMCEKFKGRLTFEKHRSCPSADVTVTGVTKGDGVSAIISVLGIKKEDTYAIGDGENDIEMFKRVGHPIAMGISKNSVKAAAEYVTGSVAEEGIYSALIKYGLID